MCSFAERRKLAFGSDSSTFFFAHFRTSGFASRRVGRSVCAEHKINYELRITNFASKREQSRTCLSYAEREQNVLRSKRPVVRSKLRPAVRSKLRPAVRSKLRITNYVELCKRWNRVSLGRCPNPHTFLSWHKKVCKKGQGSTHRADPLGVLVRWTSKTRLRLRQFDVFLRSHSHKRVPVSARRPVCLCKHKINYELRIMNYVELCKRWIKKGEHTGQAPTLCVIEWCWWGNLLRTAGRELSVRRGRGHRDAWGIEADTRRWINYELQITNYGKGRAERQD